MKYVKLFLWILVVAITCVPVAIYLLICDFRKDAPEADFLHEWPWMTLYKALKSAWKKTRYLK